MKRELRTRGQVSLLSCLGFCLVVAVAVERHGPAVSAAEAAWPGAGELTGGFAPGKLIVKFEVDSMAARALRAARIFSTALHEVGLSPELDEVKQKYNVSGIRCVFRAFDIRDSWGDVMAVETMEEHMVRVARRLGRTPPTEAEAAGLPDLTTVYSLKIAQDADVLEAVRAFSACPGVEYAQPAYLGQICGPPDPPDDYYWNTTTPSWGQGYDDL